MISCNCTLFGDLISYQELNHNVSMKMITMWVWFCSEWDQPPREMIPPESVLIKVYNGFMNSHDLTFWQCWMLECEVKISGLCNRDTIEEIIIGF